MAKPKQRDADRTVWALRRAFQTVEAAKEARLRRVGVTSAHYGILKNLSVSPGITGAELARRLFVTPQNIASLLGRMTDHGWVDRHPNETHSHVLELHLTEEGTRVLLDADAEVSELEVALQDHLGQDDTDTLRQLLERASQLGLDRQTKQ